MGRGSTPWLVDRSVPATTGSADVLVPSSELLRLTATFAVAVLLALAGCSAVVLLARRRQACRDAVTGLLSRAGLLAGTVDLRGAIGVAVVDFALVERVTDTLDHVRREAVLALLAERLRVVCRGVGVAGAARTGRGHRSTAAPPTCLLARLAGDRFAVVLPGLGAASTGRVLDGLYGHLAAPCVVEGLPFEVPVLVGVADTYPVAPLALDTYPVAPLAPATEREDDHRPGDPSSTMVAALRRAGVTLAAARCGGPAVRCYDPVLGERAARRRALIRDFARCLARRELRVHYQPLVCLDRRTVLGVEALARWQHPELGALLPDEFVPVLESSGQIGELTTFVLDEALGAARRWLDRGLRLSVAVNVPVATVGVPTFPDQVADALAAHGVPADLLTLELTESGVAAEREAARPVLAGLHTLGCRLAVDDFGTGQSTLAHLRRLPVDQVKIDKSFVLGMDAEDGDSAVVRAIVEMGHTLGMTVVAEGVERPAVRRALVAMGCDVAQGYLVSRPLPAAVLDRWLARLDVAPPTGSGKGPLTLIA